MDDVRELHIDALTKLKAFWPKEDLRRWIFNKDLEEEWVLCSWEGA